MMRRTTFWEDLGIGVLAGAIIVLTPFTWALLRAERSELLMNRIGPSGTGLHGANTDGATPVRPSLLQR